MLISSQLQFPMFKQYHTAAGVVIVALLHYPGLRLVPRAIGSCSAFSSVSNISIFVLQPVTGLGGFACNMICLVEHEVIIEIRLKLLQLRCKWQHVLPYIITTRWTTSIQYVRLCSCATVASGATFGPKICRDRANEASEFVRFSQCIYLLNVGIQFKIDGRLVLIDNINFK